MTRTDLSIRPVPFHPDPYDVRRRERSWTLMVGSRRLSFTRIDYDLASHPRLVAGRAGQADIGTRWSLTGVVALVVGTVAGLAMLGLALHATRAASIEPYRLTVAIPTRAPAKIANSAAPSRTPPATRFVAKAAVVPITPALPAAATEGAMPADAEPARLTAMQPAIAAAFDTGRLQQWTSADGAEQGFVVAGPMDGGCRTLSILTRRDGGNAVHTRRECGNADRSDDTAHMGPAVKP